MGRVVALLSESIWKLCHRKSLLLLLLAWSASAFYIPPFLGLKGRSDYCFCRRLNNRPAPVPPLFFAAEEGEKYDDVERDTIRRMDVRGVSVSPRGFLVLLSTTSTTDGGSVTMPIRVTSKMEDATSASSAESLTIIQLLSGVDMAGMILPPQCLQSLVTLFCSLTEEEEEDDDEDDELGLDGVVLVEDELGLSSREPDWDAVEAEAVTAGKIANEDATKRFVRDFVAKTLPEGVRYDEAHPWFRAKVQYPKMVLDSVRVSLGDTSEQILPTEDGSSDDGGGVQTVPLQFALDCTIDGTSKLTVPLHSEWDREELSRSILEEVTYEFDPEASGAFVSLALAMRYKAPVVVDVSSVERLVNLQSTKAGDTTTYCIIGSDEESIRKCLPQCKTLESLRSTSDRVVKSIERGFEFNKLQSALRIAMGRGDAEAAEKIQRELDKFDNLDDLPTIDKKDEEGGGQID